MKLTTMLLLAAMAGASCTSNAKNNEVTNTQECDSSATVAVEAPAQVAPEDSICNNPDVRPQYDAEDAGTFLVDFLNKNLHYPEEAVAKKVQGTVIVQMVVEKDGTPTHFEVIRKVDSLLDEETLRVAKLLPKFKSAQKDGKPVRCIFNFSVPYRL